MFPDPIPGAGDITLSSDWMTSSMASIRSWANGEVTSNGEATVLAVTDGLEASKTSMSIGGSESDMACILEGLGELGFGAKGVDSGVDFAHLVFVLTKARDVGRKSPVTQVVSCLP